MNVPLYGLVLAGGRSTRMKRDKAVLQYHGRSQLERAMDLISPLVSRAFVSVRPDQQGDPLRARFPQIADRALPSAPFTSERALEGPIAGIYAAQAEHPDVAWLVLACDLPFLDERTLQHLVESRQPDRVATAYRSSHDGLPEPVCAIYEPQSREALASYVATGKHCPRKFLIQADIALIEQPDPRALDNVNTPEEYGSAMTALTPPNGPAPKQIRVQYYALLREQAGRSEESVSTAAHTPRELYEELRQRYPFSLAPEMLRVAVNSEFSDWSQPLNTGDAVVFIPPVAGG